MSLVGAAIATAGIALALAAGGLMLANRALPPNSISSLPPPWVAGAVQTIGLITLSLISGLIVWRQPRSPLSWGATGALVCLATWAMSAEYAVYGLVIDPGSVPLADVAGWMEEVLRALVAPSVLIVILLFPDGKLKSRRWWVLVAGALVLTFWSVIVALDDPYPARVGLLINRSVPVTVPPALWPVGASLSWSSGALFPALVIAALMTGLAVTLRMRSARGEARQQLKWFAYAAVIYVITGVLARVTSVANLDWLPGLASTLDHFAASDQARTIEGWANITSVFVGMTLIPLTVGLAVLRYRLYDIDVVINRTIIYGGLAVFVTGSYAIVVAAVGSLLGQRAGLNQLLSVVAIAFLAAMLLPVRSRLQNLANRLVYGKRARPYDVLSDFAATIGRAEPADALLPRMADLLREGTGASVAEVWARVDDRFQLAASSPAAAMQPASLAQTAEIAARYPGGARLEPVFHDDEVLGALVVVKPRGDELNAVERRLFRDLASQAGLVLGRFRLVQELRESRSRIVASQDIERHRIERNLHDGAQQRFVNALLALGMAQGGTDRSGESNNLLAEASREVEAGLNELRSLARGLQPPLLAESGIAAASSVLADRAPIPTTVSAGAPERRYAQGIETAAYFVVAEALTNAVKHSGARTVEVRIFEAGSRLCIEVHDDGVGGADVSRGTGIMGLQDRVAAVGGRMAVESRPGRGTLIKAEFPCT